MHVAAWHRRTPDSKFTKFGEEMSIGQTPNHSKFCGNPTRNVRDIRNQKFVLPEKVGQNSPKLLKTCYPLKLHIMPNFIKIGETTLKKSVTKFFYILQYFGSLGDPLGQRSPVWVVTFGKTNPPLATCKISSCSNDPCPRYLLPNFVDLLPAWPTKNIQ